MKNPLPLILVVDDLPANRELLVELLDPLKYRIEEAADGPTALRLAGATPPDLILLDVMMPGMDGYEVCRRMRANPELREVPVIMITALSDQTSRLAGIEAGADDFVTKPYVIAELRARVQTITRLNRYRRLLEAQAALRASEARLHLLAEQSDDVFLFATVNPEQVTYVSPAVEKIWGLPAARFLQEARLWMQCIHPQDQARVLAAYEGLRLNHVARFAEEYRVVRPDGTVRWVLVNCTPIRDAAGDLLNLGGVARDITERKAAEEMALRSQRLENIGMLAAGIAHDFNNALAPIVMCGTLLREHVPQSAGQKLLDTMEKSAGRSVALVRQLLSFAQGASGQRQLLQTRHVLKEVSELAEVTFPKSIRVRADLPADLWPVQANPTQIHQVFLNLCINARDAMALGGELTITAANRRLDAAAAAGIPEARPGDFITVAVRDTGMGIPPDVLARIWEPFYTTKGEGKGTGLGLSTVRGLLQQHDGFVTVQTQEGHGTVFTVYLPVAAGATGNTSAPIVTAPARGANELILIVDDEEPVRTMAADILKGHGYQTLTAGDGAEAIAVFAAHLPEVRVLLTDLQMPLLDGAALASVLHRLKPGLPVITMSGVDGGNQPAGQEVATAFLAKPFRAETLLAIVHNALAKAPAPEPSPPGMPHRNLAAAEPEPTVPQHSDVSVEPVQFAVPNGPTVESVGFTP